VTKTLIGTRIAAVYELQAEWLEPRLADLGVSWATFQLLTTVSNAGDDASQIEVARRLGVTAATLSESVQNHVDRDLLSQTQSDRDKRVKILALTPASKELLYRIRDLILQSEEAMTRGLLPHELSEVAKVLERVALNLESAIDKQP